MPEPTAELRVQIGCERPVRTGIRMSRPDFAIWCGQHHLEINHGTTTICEPPLEDWLAHMPGRSVTFWLSFPVDR